MGEGLATASASLSLHEPVPPTVPMRTELEMKVVGSLYMSPVAILHGMKGTALIDVRGPSCCH
jgi:hypothetical protein